MFSEIIVQGILFSVFGFAILVGIIIWLWRCKADSDKQAFSEVLDEEGVKTYFSPEEYAEASRKRDLNK